MRWARVAGVIGVLALQAGACSGSRSDDLAACKAAHARLMQGAKKPEAVIALCDRAYQRTHAVEAIAARSLAQLTTGDLDAVIAAARSISTPDGARLWHMAGDAELERGHRAEARRWYERALEAHRNSDPRRAGMSAGRISDIAETENALDEAIRYRYLGVTLAEASGDGEARLITTLGLAELLLAVGDVRTAKRALATVASSVPDGSPFEQDYLRVAGEIDAVAGRVNAAAAGFQRCTQLPAETPNPYIQLRCRIGLAALLAEGPQSGTGAETLATIDAAATYLDPTDRLFGADPNRRAELVWLRAVVHLRAGDHARALALLDAIDRTGLGAPMLSRLDHARGRALVAKGDRAAAEASFLAAAAAIERLRDDAAYRETRRSLPRELRAPYEAIFVLRARAGDARGAVEIMERALARDFVDQLAAGVVGEHDQSLAASVEDAERRVRALALLEARPRHDFDPSSTPHAYAVGFFAAERTLWRVVLTGGEIHIAEVAPLPELARLVAAVAADPAAAEATALSARLLPADVLPARGEPIIVVPDPVLDGVRFTALRAGAGFLVERDPVILAPTFASGLVGATAGAGDEPSGPAVVLGDPDATLPSARAEATAIAALLGVSPRIGADANRTAVREARRARVLHVASHGNVRDDGTIISLADFALGPVEVLELGLRPDLAVVASCASAATRPDGMWTSITSALLAGGTRTVVGALGSIPDGAAAAILTDFHRRLPELGPVRALAAAQHDASARGVPVAVWSSFAIFGHETTRTPRRN
ncbi:MAG TPA: CHAT domain-containing protein [Kofleriaceae bacterium]|nr:CHAT domain-containing protein [Kofleriaceae bacterium]